MKEIIGDSLKIGKLKEQISKAAKYPWTVLILGETGVGKELTARAIHESGPRRDRCFVSVNCGGMPDSLIESEFFGYAKGAFTGADEDRSGKFEQAHGGTIFLDEIGNASMKLQSSLLRVLETRKISRIGGKFEKDIDARVICATNKNLKNLEKNEILRDDLLHRICSLIISVPPLRERKEDIPALARYFIKEFTEEIKKFNAEQESGITIDDSALSLLQKEDFKGNVRQLRNFLQQAVMMSGKTNGRITGEDIKKAIDMGYEKYDSAGADKPFLRELLEKNPLEYFRKTVGWKNRRMKETGLDKEDLKELERIGYEKCLKEMNISNLAKNIGIKPQTLIERLVKAGCSCRN